MKVEALQNFTAGRDSYNRGEVYEVQNEQAADWIRAGLVTPVGRVTETAALDVREVEAAVTRRRKTA